MKDQRDQPNGELDSGVPKEWRPQLAGAAPDELCADGHAAEKDHQDDDLGVRAMSNEEPEIPAPDGLVNQSGGTAEDEDRDERRDQRIWGMSRRRVRMTFCRMAFYSNGVNKRSKQVPTCLQDRRPLHFAAYGS